ncbi:hypothetical protein CCACVL1_11831 [Corchorus capsularis]|uniref:Uncharacterized protein n=1 Tax=Corchorus capsularis TaxID=210143 RepID=A0A1R3IJB4_COCAP|nr:hypothetical protein CCACVL1_11831 [Corchorus capsularis]
MGFEADVKAELAEEKAKLPTREFVQNKAEGFLKVAARLCLLPASGLGFFSRSHILCG